MSDHKRKDKRGVRVYINHIPDDIRNIILAAKSEHCLKIQRDFSYESTVYLLIREAWIAREEKSKTP